MEWHARQDAAALLAHNRALSARLIHGLDGLPVTLASPREEDARGGSVMVRATDPATAETVIGRLREKGVYADRRDALMRFSPGPVTSEAGVDALVAELRAALG